MTSSFPPVAATGDVSLDLAGHTYTFRRLAWDEEIRFAVDHPEGSRRTYVAYAMLSLDGKSVSFEQADALLRALPKPVVDRVIIFYYGSLPTRRTPTIPTAYSAPEPLAYARRVASEEDEVEDAEREVLDRTFGAEEVEESLDLGRRMVAGTNRAGVSAPTPPENEFVVEI